MTQFPLYRSACKLQSFSSFQVIYFMSYRSQILDPPPSAPPNYPFAVVLVVIQLFSDSHRQSSAPRSFAVPLTTKPDAPPLENHHHHCSYSILSMSHHNYPPRHTISTGTGSVQHLRNYRQYIRGYFTFYNKTTSAGAPCAQIRCRGLRTRADLGVN